MTAPALRSTTVVGAGAVGSFYGAMLALAGHAVTLIGRAPHVQAIRAGGLQLHMNGQTRRVPLAASTELDAVRGADVVLFCVKSTDTDAVAQQIAPLLKADALVLSLQNGVDNAPTLARHVGPRVVPVAVYVATAMPGPGEVQHNGRGDLVIGPLDAAAAADTALAARLQAVAALFDSAGVKQRFVLESIRALLSDAQAAQCIRDQKIDVLMDLSGHTAHNRLALFAWRAAPVQVSWLGYFATTGLQAMDYLLSDWACSPADSAELFTETLWRMGATRLCFAPPDAAPPVAALPAAQRGFVTFGCFQTTSKLNDAVLAAWARILQAVPTARLRIQSTRLGSAAEKAHLAARLAALGIASRRIELQGRASRTDYLAAHAGVDIILDTFPYPGGTTTCEALWMGVPTLTLAGDRLIARQGAGLLGAAGLSDWVVGDVDAYVQQAVQRASDLAGLAALRASLRARVAASALCDAKTFSNELTGALEAMARRLPAPA